LRARNTCAFNNYVFVNFIVFLFASDNGYAHITNVSTKYRYLQKQNIPDELKEIDIQQIGR